MKKILLFISILAIGLYYLDQKTRWISNRTHTIVDVSKASTILLHKIKSQEHVHGYFVHITGHIDGEGKIGLYQSSGKGSLYRSDNISGDVDIEWGGDWYANKLEIAYAPEDVNGGELSLEYAFYGM